MIDNRTKSIPTSSSEVGIYYVYISQGNKDNGVYIVSDFVLPITVTKIAELYIGDDDKANLTGGNTFTGNQIINGDITVEDITATNFLGNASTATKLKTFVNINGVAFDGSSNITIYDGTKEATITPGNTSQYFRGDKTWQTLNKIVVGLPNVDNTADANKNVLSATKLTIPRTINDVSFDGSENIVINAVDSTPRIPMSYMGIANGVATLDSTGIIPITQLPSYVDDVIEVANYASLPIIGESGKIYVTTNNNKTYRWSGSIYIYITSGAVDSVNGYTGVVVLTKSDFILGNVDNTSDVNKPISIATQGALDLKQNLLTLGNFTSTTPGITISNGNGAVIGSGITFNITTAGTTTGGLITSGHWNTFNNKWDSSNHPITTLGYGLPDYPTTLPASDVYSWAKQITKPTYSYSEITSKPTLLSQFTNDLGNYGGWITGINSGMVTTALGYTPWHSGNHPTTISGYGITDIPTYSGSNFILNQSASAQSANMWINGSGKFGSSLIGVNGVAGTPLTVQAGSGANAVKIIGRDDNLGYLEFYGNNGTTLLGDIYGANDGLHFDGAATFASTVYSKGFDAYRTDGGAGLVVNGGDLGPASVIASFKDYNNNVKVYIDGRGVLASNVATGTAPLTVNSTTMVGNLNADLLDGNHASAFLTTSSTIGSTNILGTVYNGTTNQGIPTNLIGGYSNGYIYNFTQTQLQSWLGINNNLSTNYIPKWNGSSFVNSLISDDSASVLIKTAAADGRGLNIFTVGANNDPYIKLGRTNGETDVFNIGLRGSTGDSATLALFGQSGASTGLIIKGNGIVNVLNTTPSTSPNTGALVVGGGMGVGGIITMNNSYQIQWGSSNAMIYGHGTNGTISLTGNTSVSGTVTASNFILSSDRTLKTNIQPIIKDYSRLNLVSFNFKTNLDELRFGTIAQDLLSDGYSEFVTGDKEGEYKVKYIDLIIAKLASAELRIKELEDKYGSR